MKTKVIHLICFVMVSCMIVSGCAGSNSSDDTIYPEEKNTAYQGAVPPASGYGVVDSGSFSNMAKEDGAEVEEETDENDAVSIEAVFKDPEISFWYSDVTDDPLLDALGTDVFSERLKEVLMEGSSRDDVELFLDQSGYNYHLYSVIYPETSRYYAVYAKMLVIKDSYYDTLLQYASTDKDLVDRALAENQFLQKILYRTEYADCVDQENARTILRNYGDVVDDSEGNILSYVLDTEDYYINYWIESDVSDADYQVLYSDFIKDYMKEYNDDVSTLSNMEIIGYGENYYEFEAMEIFSDGDTVPYHLWRFRPEDSTNLIMIESNQYTDNTEEYQTVMDLLIQTSVGK